MLGWYEYSSDGEVYMTCSQADAIQRQKEYAHTIHGYHYLCDEDALLDSMSVHWAFYVGPL